MKDLKNKRKDLLRKIKVNPPLKRQFFRELAKTSNPFPWLKDLIEEGYFNEENFPGIKEDSEKKGYYTVNYWEPSGYLENLAKLNYVNEDPETTELLTDIYNNYIIFDFEERNYRTDHVFLKVIFYLPKDKITIDHIRFISKIINSKFDTTLIQSELSKTVLKKLIDYELRELLLELLNVLLDFKKVSDHEFVSIMDKFWLNKTLEDNKPAIAKFCAIDAAKIALNKISKILNDDESEFDYFAIPTIEDHPQSMFPEEIYEFQLVYFVRDMLSSVNYSEELRTCTEKLAASKHRIFKRIAIFIINLHYDELNDIFWNWDDNPLDDINLRHDVYRLFKSNYSKFDDDNKKIESVLEWIDNKKYIHKLEEEGSKPEYIAYEKLRWLSAFEQSKNPKIQKEIKENKELYPKDIDHPDFDVWSSDLIVVGPAKSEELCEKSNEELAEYLNENDTKESVFDKSEITESFIKCVTDHPSKFTSDLNHFLNVSRENQSNLIRGLERAWSSEKTFECKEIFEFILLIIEDEKFWETNYIDKTNYRNWIVSAIADFIETGTRDDRYAFEIELLPVVEKILLILSINTQAELPKMHDLITSVLNSPLGKIYSAMVIYSLKYFRESDEFPDEIRLELERQLKDPSIEILVTLGRFLPYLCALDKEWVKNNINLIFPDEIDKWEPAFMGYLFYSSVIYTNIYNFLKSKGHYDRAIETRFDNRRITQKLIQHICTFYIDGKEDLSDPDSLISKVINQKNTEQLSFLIHFILVRKESIKVDQVKELWLNIFNALDKENIENCEIFAKLARWIELIDAIDNDIFNWLIFSAKCMESHSNMAIFINNLTKHVDKSPDKVGKIYLAFIDKTPEYDQEDIQYIVEVLFQKKVTKVANYICNEYRKKGFDFLKDIHDEYN